jgi:hypothetical protein
LANDIERVRDLIREPTAVDFESDLEAETQPAARPKSQRRSKGIAARNT